MKRWCGHRWKIFTSTANCLSPTLPPSRTYLQMLPTWMERQVASCSRYIEMFFAISPSLFSVSLLSSLLLSRFQTLEELSLMLSTTCDTFLNTLAECMDLSYNDSQWVWSVGLVILGVAYMQDCAENAVYLGCIVHVLDIRFHVFFCII